MAKVAFVLADDFEDSEFRRPFDYLTRAGHAITVVGPKAGEKVSGKRHQESSQIDLRSADARGEDFDALVIPGGYSPDRLRLDPGSVRLVREMMAADKPVAAVCHGPQLLIEADVLEGRRLTSWPSVRKDIENAGGTWVDQAVIEDGNLITSRKPDDLDLFCAALGRRL